MRSYIAKEKNIGTTLSDIIQNSQTDINIRLLLYKNLSQTNQDVLNVYKYYKYKIFQ